MKFNKLHTQFGQALPVGIALFFILGVLSFSFFNTSQSVAIKTRVVNTADSAAYSGLLWQARAMNFTAYTNRAMVANEVAIAQAVSLNSWAGYLNLTGDNLHAILGKVPYIGAITGLINSVSSTVDSFLTPISQGMLTVVNSINAGISVAQESMYMATFLATPDVVNSVVASNDVRNQGMSWDSAFSIMNSARNLEAWGDLTQSFDHESKLAIHERAHMIRESMDRFSLERKWRFFNFFIPVTPLNWVRLEKDGTTVLLGNETGDSWEWQANDAHSIRAVRFTWRGKKLDELPVAGGSSMANNEDTFDSTMGEEHRFHGNRHTLAKRRKQRTPILSTHDGRQLNGYTGLHAYRALSADWRESDEPPTLKLNIEITVDPSALVSAENINSKTNLTNSIDSPGNIISSVSSAELFFERPCVYVSCDNSEEYADGYSPFWDVRLAKNSIATRLAAYALHGDTLTDRSHFTQSKIVQLPNYTNLPATPVTDYQEQSKGVNRLLVNMESHLQSLEESSPEFHDYRTRLDRIRSQINLQVGSIVDDLIYEDLNEQDLVQSIVHAAGFEFDAAEFDQISAGISGIYGELVSINGLESLRNQLTDSVNGAVEKIEKDIRDALEERLRTAVETILKNLLVSAIENNSGLGDNDALIEHIANETVEGILSTTIEPVHPTDIAIDLDDECSVYTAIRAAELEVEQLQQQLEKVNHDIAVEFYSEMVRVTQLAVAKKHALKEEIERLRQLLNAPWSPRTYNDETYLDQDGFRDEVMVDLNQALLALNNLYSDRVGDLTRLMMEISDRHTKTITQFSDYRLDYEFALQAVMEILGDTTSLEIDGNVATIAQSLFLANANEELNSETDQSYTEKPESC